MSHLSPAILEMFFKLEEYKARQIFKKEMKSCMDKIFVQMKRNLMELVESGRGGDVTGDGAGNFDYPTDRGQEHYESSNDFNSIPSSPTNSHFSDNANSNQFQDDDDDDDDQITVSNELEIGIVNIALNNEEDLEFPNIQLFDDFYENVNDSSSRPTKRARMENDEADDEAQTEMSSHRGVGIPLYVKCTNCSVLLPATQEMMYPSSIQNNLNSIQSRLNFYLIQSSPDPIQSNPIESRSNSGESIPGPSQLQRSAQSIQFQCNYCLAQYEYEYTHNHVWTEYQPRLYRCAQPDCGCTLGLI